MQQLLKEKYVFSFSGTVRPLWWCFVQIWYGGVHTAVPWSLSKCACLVVFPGVSCSPLFWLSAVFSPPFSFFSSPPLWGKKDGHGWSWRFQIKTIMYTTSISEKIEAVSISYNVKSLLLSQRSFFFESSTPFARKHGFIFFQLKWIVSNPPLILTFSWTVS